MRKKITIILSLTLFIILMGFILFLSQKTGIKALYNNLFQKTQKPIVCQQMNQGLLTKKINDIAMTKDGELYVGTDIGMFKSIDYGKSWHIINEGLSSNAPSPYISKIIIDNSYGYDGTAHIYALVGEYSPQIFESFDKGMHWFEVPSPEGSIIDIDIAQFSILDYDLDLYALSYKTEPASDSSDDDDDGDKKIYYFNHLVVSGLFTTDKSPSEFLEHVLKTGSLVDKHWESQPININLENDSLERLIIWNQPYLLTKLFSNLFESLDQGKTWNKVIIDNDLINNGFIHAYSAFSDSLPANYNSSSSGPIVAFEHIPYSFPYQQDIITLYALTRGGTGRVPNEEINKQRLKIGERELDIILYYPGAGDKKKNKMFHYYIPVNYQATYQHYYQYNTLFIASNEGVFSCDLK